ncbi:MAG: outer membrane beta-barrel protein [Bacteroidota bacterium]
MSQHKKNTEDKIREKLQAHEFDFSPAAWEQMEQMLDKPRPALGGPARDLSIAPGWSRWLKGGLFIGVLLLTALLTWYLKAKTTVDLIEHTELQQGNLSTPAQERTLKVQQTLQAKRNQAIQDHTLSALPAPAPNLSSSPAGSPKVTQSARKLAPGAKVGSAITGFSKQQSSRTEKSARSAAQSLSTINTTANQPSTQSAATNMRTANFNPKSPTLPKSEASNSPALAGGQPRQPNKIQSNSRARFGSLEEIPTLITPLENKPDGASGWGLKPLKAKYNRRAQLGFSVGAISNNMSSNGISIDNTNGFIQQSSRRFWTVGLLARFPFSELLSLQVELNYHQFDAQYNLRLIGPDEFSAAGNVPSHMFSLPVLAHLNLGHGFRFTGGFAANLNLVNNQIMGVPGAEPAFNEVYLGVQKSYEGRTLQGVFISGVGYDWRRFSADLRYERYLGSATNPLEVQRETYRLQTRSSNLSLRFSYRFDARRLLGH